MKSFSLAEFALVRGNKDGRNFQKASLSPTLQLSIFNLPAAAIGSGAGGAAPLGRAQAASTLPQTSCCNADICFL